MVIIKDILNSRFGYVVFCLTPILGGIFFVFFPERVRRAWKKSSGRSSTIISKINPFYNPEVIESDFFINCLKIGGVFLILFGLAELLVPLMQLNIVFPAL